MKILFLGDFDPDEIVPAPIKVGKELFKSFINSGHHIFYLPYFQDGNIYSRIQKLIGFEKITEGVYRTGIFPLVFFVLKFRPQIIHIFTPGLYYVVLFPLRILLKFKIVTTLHSINRYVIPRYSNLRGYQKFRFLLIERLTVKYSNTVFVYSQRDKRYVSRYYNVEKSIINVVSNGITLLDISKKNWSTKSCLKIAIIGNINRVEKGYNLLFKVLPELENEIELSLFSHEKQDELNDIFSDTKMIRRYDPLGEKEFRNELIKSDLFILPSIYESFSISLLEAMNSGLLVLVSSRVGLTEKFPEDLKKMIFRKNDSKHLLEKINYILNLSIEQVKDLSAIITRFAKNYSWNEIAKIISQNYQQVLTNED